MTVWSAPLSRSLRLIWVARDSSLNVIVIIHHSKASMFLWSSMVPADSPSGGGGVAIYVFDINQPSLPTPFCSVLVSVSVFMALSTVFHSINSPDNSPLSHSVLPILFLPYWSFQLHTSYESPLQPCYNPLWSTGLKATIQ